MSLASLKISPFLEKLLQEDLASKRRGLDKNYNLLLKKEHQTKVCNITPYVNITTACKIKE